MSRIRASSLPSQALLMQQRGDLRGTSARFRVQLDKPSPVTIHADPIARIGMEVKRDSSRSRLLIEDVDENPRQRTPIAQWNTAEERQADRGEEEKHCSMAIKPGDRIKAVNDLNSATLMLSELQEAAKPDDPRQLSLEVSRDISNVLAPAPQKLRVNSVPTIPESPSDRPTSICSRPPKPPRSPSKGGERGRASTGVNWRSPSKEEHLSLPGVPMLDCRDDARGRMSAGGASKRRAASTGAFERQMMKSPSVGSLSSAGKFALRS